MKILILNQTDVSRLLPMGECIEVMTATLQALSHGDAILPLRSTMWMPDRTGALVMMPAYLGNINAAGLKVITYFAGNRGTRLDTHQGGRPPVRHQRWAAAGDHRCDRGHFHQNRCRHRRGNPPPGPF